MADGHHNQLMRDHKLFSLEQVAAIFSLDGKTTPKVVREVERYARQAGTYIKFGDNLLFSGRDINNLIDWLRPRGTGKAFPLDTEDVMLVVFGMPVDVNAEVYVGWCYHGHIDEALSRVQTGAPGTKFLDARNVSYGEFKQHLISIASERLEGFWYHRTPKFNAWLVSTFAEAENDNSNEVRNETD